MIASDSSFKWYKQNLKPYTAGKDAAVFATHRNSVHLVIFPGTWCEDPHIIIPKLFPFLDAAGFSNDHITVIGVDRNKKTISHPRCGQCDKCTNRYCNERKAKNGSHS